MEQPKAPWRSGICQNKVSTPTLPEGPERYGSNLILPQISQTAEKDSIREQKSGAQFNRSRSRDSSTVPLPASSIAALLQSAMSCGAAHRTIPAEGVSRAIRLHLPEENHAFPNAYRGNPLINVRRRRPPGTPSGTGHPTRYWCEKRAEDQPCSPLQSARPGTICLFEATAGRPPV